MRIEVAEHRHEQALRDLCRQSPMPGWIRLAFGRDPDFFHALDIQGKLNQVIIAVEGERLVGMGCRSVRPAWVNGQRTDIGYLGGLRLIPEIRGSGAMARAYAVCKTLHTQRPVPAYLSTIIEENTAAVDLLTSGRAGLPHYVDRGRYFTYAINLNRHPRRRRPCTLVIRRGGEIPLERLTAFLSQCGSQRQFFPAIDSADFGTDYLRGLRLEDFRVATDENGEVAGVAAVWDQHSFKQNIVEGYGLPVRVFRPVINGALRLTGFRALPMPGKTLNMLYVAFCCVRENDPLTMRALLEQIYADCHLGDHHFLVLGFHEHDPLRVAVDSFLAFRYTSRLYLVCWDDGLDFVKRLDPDRIPHIEVATL